MKIIGIHSIRSTNICINHLQQSWRLSLPVKRWSLIENQKFPFSLRSSAVLAGSSLPGKEFTQRKLFSVEFCHFQTNKSRIVTWTSGGAEANVVDAACTFPIRRNFTRLNNYLAYYSHLIHHPAKGIVKRNKNRSSTFAFAGKRLNYYLLKVSVTFLIASLFLLLRSTRCHNNNDETRRERERERGKNV